MNKWRTVWFWTWNSLIGFIVWGMASLGWWELMSKSDIASLGGLIGLIAGILVMVAIARNRHEPHEVRDD